MKKWPEIEVLTRGAQKRGGQRTGRSMKAKFLVQVTARTEMPCGEVFSSSDRVPSEEADDKKRSIKIAIQLQARRHIDKCKKGCKK